MKTQFKTLLCLLAVTIFGVTNLHAQSNGVTLRFSANHTCAHSALDSILIENLSQGGSTTLYYPDTVVTFVFTDIGIVDSQFQGLYVSQNYPNPFSETTLIDVFVPAHDQLSLSVYDLSGRQVCFINTSLDAGMHQFRFDACQKQAYLLVVNSRRHAQTRLMLQMGAGSSSQARITYEGTASGIQVKSSGSGFVFNLGDELRYTGYVTDFLGEVDYEIITDSPETDQEYLFDIANQVPQQPSEIDGESTVLGNETGLMYEVEQVHGVTYYWIVPEDWTITQGQGSHSITTDAGIESGDIIVQAENDCGIGPERNLAVGVKFSLTLKKSSEYGGEITGAGHYDEGKEVAIAASPNEGWEFLGWTGDTDYLDDPNEANTTVTMPAQHVFLTATFYTGTVTDIDGNVYPTVSIGNQEWMAENLRVTRDANGNNILRYCYGNNSTNCELYGGLYNWNTVMNGASSSDSNPSGVQGICPDGWHVPSDAEWTELRHYVRSQGFQGYFAIDAPGNALKSCRQDGSPLGGEYDTSEHPRWDANDTHYGFDVFGFSALPGGGSDHTGSYSDLGKIARWYSSTSRSPTTAWFWAITEAGSFYRHYAMNPRRFSLRCVRNPDEQTQLPTVTTTPITDITQTNATSGGNITAEGGAEITVRGIVWSTKEHPAINNYLGYTNDGQDTGEFTSTLHNLSPATVYYVRAYATNDYGTAYGEQVSFSTLYDFDGLETIYGGGVTDIDGNQYITVIMGDQEWMAENLRTTRDAEGNDITRYCYDNDPDWCELYGGLYTWNTLMNGQNSSSSNPSGVQGICPAGWHVPSHNEWTQLEQYICNALGNSDCETKFPYDHSAFGWSGTNEGNALKSCRQIDSPLGGDCAISEHPRWDSHDAHYGFDVFGFSALPGGYRHGAVYYLGARGYWWSSTEYSSSYAWFRDMGYHHGSVTRSSSIKDFYFNIRCVRNI